MAERPVTGGDAGPVELRYRPYRDEDFEFVYQVGKAALGPYVVELFGPWDDDEHRQQLARRVQTGHYRIVVADGQEVGLTSHEWHPTHLHLRQLFLLPRVHNRGLGARIVQDFQAEARDRGLPIHLRVLANNPARRLYQRLGFVVTETTPERYHMEWRPS